jgi:hypothetical protein
MIIDRVERGSRFGDGWATWLIPRGKMDRDERHDTPLEMWADKIDVDRLAYVWVCGAMTRFIALQ